MFIVHKSFHFAFNIPSSFFCVQQTSTKNVNAYMSAFNAKTSFYSKRCKWARRAFWTWTHVLITRLLTKWCKFLYVNEYHVFNGDLLKRIDNYRCCHHFILLSYSHHNDHPDVASSL